MYTKERVKQFLEEKNIPHRWVDHEAAYTIEEIHQLGLENKDDVAKNLFLRDGKGSNHYLFVVRGEKTVDLKAFSKAYGLTRLSFASPERLLKYLGLTKGSVTPLGVLNDINHEVSVYFDQDLLQMEEIGVHPNDNTASVFLSVADMLRIVREQGNPLEIVEIP